MTTINTTPRVTSDPNPRHSRSLEYGAAMLECFAANRIALRISELADMVGISRSTTHRYATTLVKLGFLEQDDKRRYRLTHQAAWPGMSVIDTIRKESRARTMLEDLREQTRLTVSLGLLYGARAIYIHRLPAHGTGQYQADGNLGVGAHLPAHRTAIGKAMLSSLLDTELRCLLPDMCTEGTEPGKPTATESLLAEIERVKTNGIATCDEEYANGARSIAAPVTRWLEKPILAVEITAQANTYTIEELLGRFGQQVKHAAKLISV